MEDMVSSTYVLKDKDAWHVTDMLPQPERAPHPGRELQLGQGPVENCPRTVPQSHVVTYHRSGQGLVSQAILLSSLKV